MLVRESCRGIARVGLATVAAVLALFVSAAPGAGQQLAKRLLRFASVIDGPAERPLRWPVAVAAGGADELAVADAHDARLVIYHRVGAGWPTRREVSLPAPPAAVAFVGGRYLVAMRGSSGLVAVEGGESTAAPTPISLPEQIVPGRLAAGSDGSLFVWDSRGGRVVKLNDGKVVAQSKVDAAVTALASDGAGGCWAAIGARGELLRFDGEGRPSASWRLPVDGPVPPWPSGLAVEPSGRLYVLDRHAHRVIVLDAGGSLLGLGSGSGWEPGELRFPDGIARLPGGALLVGDGGNGRAQLFEAVGPGAG